MAVDSPQLEDKVHSFLAKYERTFYGFAAALVLLILGIPLLLLGILMYCMSFQNPSRYAPHISTSAATYAQIDQLTRDEFEWRIYAYDENQFLDVLNERIDAPSVADKLGRLPVLKFDGDIYVITRKWINESAGVAISDDPNFKSKLESLNHCFRVNHFQNNLYTWDLDLETPAPSESSR